MDMAVLRRGVIGGSARLDIPEPSTKRTHIQIGDTGILSTS
jgi:hypothetical protein